MDAVLCIEVHIIPSFFPHKGTANNDSAGMVGTLFFVLIMVSKQHSLKKKVDSPQKAAGSMGD